jgi:hypothetical protein
MASSHQSGTTAEEPIDGDLDLQALVETDAARRLVDEATKREDLVLEDETVAGVIAALSREGYDTARLSEGEARALIQRAIGYVTRDVHAQFEALERVEDNIAALEAVIDERRDIRDERWEEYHRLQNATGIHPKRTTEEAKRDEAEEADGADA